MEFEILNEPIIRGGVKVKSQFGGIGGGRKYYSSDIIKVKVINIQKLL